MSPNAPLLVGLLSSALLLPVSAVHQSALRLPTHCASCRVALRSGRPPLALAAATDAAAEDRKSWALEINLGDDGEPKGRTTVNFKPMLRNSELIQARQAPPVGHAARHHARFSSARAAPRAHTRQGATAATCRSQPGGRRLR